MGPLPGLEGVPEDLGSCLEFPEALLGNLKSSGDMLVLWVVLVESGGGVDEGQNEGEVLSCPSKSGLQWGMGGKRGQEALCWVYWGQWKRKWEVVSLQLPG